MAAVASQPQTPTTPISPSSEIDYRQIMDNNIQAATRAGRASLTSLEDAWEAGLNFKDVNQFKADQSERVVSVMEHLAFTNRRVAEDNDKYIVTREGITSFVYLANDKNTAPSRAHVD